MMHHWPVPWTFDMVVNFLFLSLATIVVVAVPLVYGLRANLRDPLARAVLAGTSATGLAFLVTALATVAFHAGWLTNMHTWDWIARGTYLAVALGKATLLYAFMRLLRSQSRGTVREPVSRNRARGLRRDRDARRK